MMEGLGCVFISSKYRVTKGFKFHSRPKTGLYSCLNWAQKYPIYFRQKNGRLLFVCFDCLFVATLSDFGSLF